MRAHLIFFIIICITLLTGSCTTLRRFSSVSEPGSNNNLAGIELFGLSLSRPDAAATPKSLLDLSADAQSQLIKILNTRYPDNGMFLNSLNLQFLPERDKLNIDSYANRDLRLIFSVNKIRKYSSEGDRSGIEISPADRLEYLKIKLTVPENSGLNFKSWNRYGTEYGSVDIGDISFTRTLQLNTSGDLSSNVGRTGIDVSVDGSSSLSRREDQSVKYRYLVLNGKINDSEIEMEEEGTREIDLTGNITADISLGFNTFPETLIRIGGLDNNSGEINEPDELLVDCSVVAVPAMRNIKDSIKAELEMYYVYRNVVRGSKTFPEWDDQVKYYTGSVKKTVMLFAAKDYVPDLYCIGIDGSVRELLKIKAPDNYLYALKFRSYEEASSFYGWLMKYLSSNNNLPDALKIGGQSLVFKDSDLTYDQIKGNSLFRVMSYY